MVSFTESLNLCGCCHAPARLRNVFDFAVSALSLSGLLVEASGAAKTGFISLLRVLRVARVFRLIPKARASISVTI